MIFFTPGFLGCTLQNQQSTHAWNSDQISATKKSDHGMCGTFIPKHMFWTCVLESSSTWKKPRNKKFISVAGGNMWNQGSKNSSTIQTQTWLVRRYAFQHPQRAGDIARLLPSSFILRNPRDCKDFQRQAGWIFLQPTAYETLVATQRCFGSVHPENWGEDLQGWKMLKTSTFQGVMIWLVMFEHVVGSWVFSVNHFEMVSFHALEVDRYPSW